MRNDDTEYLPQLERAMEAAELEIKELTLELHRRDALLEELQEQLAPTRFGEPLVDTKVVIAELRAQLAAHDAELLNDEKRNPWKSAIIDAAVVNWTLAKEHESNPRAAVHALLVMESQMALDPQISQDAAALVANAKKATLLEAADYVDTNMGGTTASLYLRRMAEGMP